MISDDIDLDHLLAEIDEQIELLEILAERNPIFAELLRVMREARATIDAQNLQIQRLEELIDLDGVPELTTLLDLGNPGGDPQG